MRILWWVIKKDKIKYCLFFHTLFMKKKGFWYCSKCKHEIKARPGDGLNCGPM